MNEYVAGSTSVVELIDLLDSTKTDGSGKTGLVFNTSGLTCYYKRSNGTADVAVTLVTITTLGTFVSGGFKEIDATNQPGAYEFHPPNAAFASGAKWVTFYFVGATGLARRPVKYRILAVDPDTAGANGIYPSDAKAINAISTSSVTTVNANQGTTQPVAFTGTGASALVKGDAVDIGSDGTAGSNAALAFNGTGYFGATAPAQQQQLSFIAISGGPNAVAAAMSITTGTETGTFANTSALDGSYDQLAQVGGAGAGVIDFYYQFNLSGTTGAMGINVDWYGYVAGAGNTVKVYAWNWGNSAWDQIGSIPGVASAANGEQEWDITTAHTGTAGNAGLVRIRFNGTTLTASSVFTDRILLSYVVMPLAAASFVPPANWSLESIDSNGRLDVIKINGTPQTALDFGGTWTAAKAAHLDADVGSRMATYTQPTGFLGATFPGGTIANTTNITGGIITTVSGDVQGKILGGGSGVVTAYGVWALDGGGNAVGTAANQTTLLGRITSTRGTYLDNLNTGGLVASQADVQNVQKNTFIGTNIPLVLERPDAGSENVKLAVIFNDETGSPADIDAAANPTVVLVNNAGTDLSGRISAWTHAATGKYTATYTNTSTDALDNIHWEVTGTINTKLRRHVITTQLVDTTAVDFTNSDRTDLQTVKAQALLIATNAGDSPNTVTANANVAGLRADYTTPRAAKLDNLDTNVGSRLATSGYTAPDNANIGVAATQATNAANSASAIATILSGITSLAKWLRAGFRKSAPDTTALSEINLGGGTYDATEDAQEAIRDHGDAAWITGSGGSGAGSGANTVFITVTDGVNPLVGAHVRISGAQNAGSVDTNGSGQVQLALDPGAVTVTITATGFIGYTASQTISNVGQWVSAASSTLTVALSAFTISAPTNASQTTGYCSTYGGGGTLLSSVMIEFRLVDPGANAGSFDLTAFTAASGDGTINPLGLLQVPLLKNAKYVAKRGLGDWVPFQTGSADTQQLPGILSIKPFN